MRHPGQLVARLSSKDILIRGSIMGAIITIPTIVVFLGLWAITGDMIMPAAVGAAVHIAAMIFALKFANKILIKKDQDR